MNNFISLSEKTAAQLLHMIVVDKQYAPDERLPNEGDLAEILQVSRTSLREAVKMLISNNVLEIRRGVGTFVTSTPAIASNSIFGSYTDNMQQALDALKIRLIIEPDMVMACVHLANSKEKAIIAKHEEECRKLILAAKDYTFEDHLFHKHLASASHNATYEKLLPILHTSITIILRSGKFEKTATKSSENALIYHKKIVDALLDGDDKGAALASKTHIYNAIKYLEEYL